MPNERMHTRILYFGCVAPHNACAAHMQLAMVVLLAKWCLFLHAPSASLSLWGGLRHPKANQLPFWWPVPEFDGPQHFQTADYYKTQYYQMMTKCILNGFFWMCWA